MTAFEPHLEGMRPDLLKQVQLLQHIMSMHMILQIVQWLKNLTQVLLKYQKAVTVR